MRTLLQSHCGSGARDSSAVYDSEDDGVGESGESGAGAGAGAGGGVFVPSRLLVVVDAHDAANWRLWPSFALEHLGFTDVDVLGGGGGGKACPQMIFWSLGPKMCIDPNLEREHGE